MNFDNDNSGSGSGSSQDFEFEGGPLFTNDGIVAYPDKDKNGNWYLHVRTPAGLRFNLFVNNGAHNGLGENFNKLVDTYNQK